jgi:hypothetical protein
MGKVVSGTDGSHAGPGRTERSFTPGRKIRSLPPEKVAEVEDFVEFLAQRDDRQLAQAAAKLAEKAFRRIWNNPADAAYDRL